MPAKLGTLHFKYGCLKPDSIIGILNDIKEGKTQDTDEKRYATEWKTTCEHMLQEHKAGTGRGRKH